MSAEEFDSFEHKDIQEFKALLIMGLKTTTVGLPFKSLLSRQIQYHESIFLQQQQNKQKMFATN